jgi:hypothetical protein
LGQVLISGQIPDSPRNRAIADVLTRTVAAQPAVWNVRIHRLPHTTWWLLRFKRSADGLKRELLLDPYEEPLEMIAAGVMGALKDERALQEGPVSGSTR